MIGREVYKVTVMPVGNRTLEQVQIGIYQAPINVKFHVTLFIFIFTEDVPFGLVFTLEPRPNCTF